MLYFKKFQSQIKHGSIQPSISIKKPDPYERNTLFCVFGVKLLILSASYNNCNTSHFHNWKCIFKLNKRMKAEVSLLHSKYKISINCTQICLVFFGYFLVMPTLKPNRRLPMPSRKPLAICYIIDSSASVLMLTNLKGYFYVFRVLPTTITYRSRSRQTLKPPLCLSDALAFSDRIRYACLSTGVWVLYGILCCWRQNDSWIRRDKRDKNSAKRVGGWVCRHRWL